MSDWLNAYYDDVDHMRLDDWLARHRHRKFLRLGAPLNRAGDLRNGEFAFTQRQVQLVSAVETKFANELGQRHRMNRQALQLTFEQLLALRAVLVFVLLAKISAHFGAAAR